MSEHTPKHEAATTPELHNGHHEQSHESVEKAKSESEQHQHPDRVEHLKKQAETHAVSATETSHIEHASVPGATHVNHELKQLSFDRSISRVRKHLSAPDRALSRIIHQPAIEKISDIASKTVARPSGFLGGSIFALAGSLVLLYATKHYGYEYNFMIFGMLFIGGFFAGMIIELLVRWLWRDKRA